MKKLLGCLWAACAVQAVVAAVDLSVSIYDDTLGRAYSGTDAKVGVTYSWWQGSVQTEMSGSASVKVGETPEGAIYAIVLGSVQGEELDPGLSTWDARGNPSFAFRVVKNDAGLANGFLTNRVDGAPASTSGTYGSASVVLHVVHARRTLTYASSGDDVEGLPEPESFVSGVAKELSVDEPVRPGYVFRGWARAATSRTVEFYPGATVTLYPDTTLYAIWEANTYSVVFNANGGTGSMSSQSFTYGTPKALATNAFSRTGYVFKGWSTTSGGAVEYRDGATVSTLTTETAGTVVLYAVWESNGYLLTVDPNGGTYEGSTEATSLSPTIPYDSKQWNAIGAASRTGYILRGYFADREGETRVYDDAGKNVSAGGYWSAAYPDGTWRHASDLRVFALWRAVKYTIAFNANGGKGTSTLANVQLSYDESVALPENVYARTGYDFLGWSTNAAASVAAYTDQETVSNLSASEGAVVTLYAVWRPHEYAVAFNANGGSGEMANQDGFCYGEATGLATNLYVWTGHAFLGWARSATATAIEYADGAVVSNLTDVSGGTVTLYAVWRPHEYTIAFDANGGTREMNPQAATYDIPVSLTSNKFTRVGYAFGGWAEEPDGAAVFQNGATVTNLTAVDGATVTLYAFWEAGRYTIAYDANGGTGTMAPTTNVAYGTRVDLATNAFSSAGRTFFGWARSATAKVAEYQDGATVSNLTATSGETVTLYAVWDAHAYTVAFDANGGTGTMAPVTLEYGVATNLPANAFSRTGAAFKAWQVAGGTNYADGAAVSNLTEVAGQTVTLYAQWEADKVDLTFDMNGGSGTADARQVAYGAVYGVLPDTLTRDGYTFDGWETMDGKDVTAATLVEATAPVELRARWTANVYTVVFDANGGEAWKAPFEKIVRYDEAFALPTETYAYAGFVFDGWEFGGTTYAVGDVVSNLTTTASGSVTFVAQWQPVSYTVVFDGNGGTCTTNGASAVTNELAFGESLEVPIFERVGRVFQNWSCGGTTNLEGMLVSNLTTTAGATVTMTAQWGIEPNALSDALDTDALAFVNNAGEWKVVAEATAENGDCLALRGADIANGVVLKADADSDGTLVFHWKFAGDYSSLPPSGTFNIRLYDLLLPPGSDTLWTTNLSYETAYVDYYTPHWEGVTISLDTTLTHQLRWEILSATTLAASEGILLDHVTWTPSGGAAGAKVVPVPVAVAGLVDDGKEKTGVAPSPDGDYTLGGNVATDAGGYLATATLTDKTGSVWADGTTDDRTIPWRIAEAPRDLSGVTFDDKSFVADGNPKALAISGALPAGVTVNYEGNDRTEIGSYQVTAWFKADDVVVANLAATLTIVAREVEVPVAVAGLVYDGTPQMGVVAGDGYALAGNVATNASDYIARATLAPGCVWKEDGSVEEKEIPWSIERASYDMSGVTFESATVIFDGAVQSLEVDASTLPDGVSVLSYVSNDKIGPGEYTVRARFVGDANHEPIPDMTATLTINARRVPVPVAIDGLVYDGTAQTGVAVSPDGDYTLVGNIATNAATYTATAKLAKTGCVWAADDTAGPWEIKWSIARATYDMSGVKFESKTFEADGTPKSLTVSGMLPAGVTVTYEGNGKTEPGSSTVTAKFTGDAANYEPIPDMTATLTLTQKSEPTPGPDDPTPGPDDPTPGPDDPTPGPDDPTPGPDDPTPGPDDPTPSPDDPTPGPDDPTPGPDDPDPEPVDETPELHPDGVASLGAFTAEKAAIYNGWLKDGQGAIVALLTVKTTAAKAGRETKATIVTTPIGGKKKTRKAAFLPGGNPTDAYGIVYGARGLLGTLDGYSVEASADVYKSKIAEVKALSDQIPVGVRTFSVETESGPAVFSVSVAKTGKAKTQGFLADGTKISVSPTGALGDNYFAVPVVLSKKTVSFGLVFWIPLKGGASVAANFSRTSWKAARAGGAIALSDGAHVFDCELPAFRAYLTTVDGFDVAPAPASFTVVGKKWDAGRTSGRLKIVDGVPAVTGTSAPSNLAALKFTYTASTGLVKGSFKLYYLDGTRLKNEKATIVGAVVDGKFTGSATIKKLGAFPVAAE